MSEENQPAEKDNVIGLEAMCFKCSKVWNISMLKSTDLAARCESCGGYVITPSGKANLRYVPEGEDITSPLLNPKMREKMTSHKVTHVDEIKTKIPERSFNFKPKF